jgi:hypothetical protein
MSISPSAPPTRQKRVPREGCFFTGLRAAAWLLLPLGSLTLLGTLAGFILTLVRIAPELASAWNHLEQKFAGFVLIILFSYLGIFAILGLAGLVLLGLGVVCWFSGTRMAEISAEAN